MDGVEEQMIYDPIHGKVVVEAIPLEKNGTEDPKPLVFEALAFCLADKNGIDYQKLKLLNQVADVLEIDEKLCDKVFEDLDVKHNVESGVEIPTETFTKIKILKKRRRQAKKKPETKKPRKKKEKLEGTPSEMKKKVEDDSSSSDTPIGQLAEKKRK